MSVEWMEWQLLGILSVCIGSNKLMCVWVVVLIGQTTCLTGSAAINRAFFRVKDCLSEMRVSVIIDTDHHIGQTSLPPSSIKQREKICMDLSETFHLCDALSIPS